MATGDLADMKARSAAMTTAAATVFNTLNKSVDHPITTVRGALVTLKAAAAVIAALTPA